MRKMYNLPPKQFSTVYWSSYTIKKTKKNLNIVKEKRKHLLFAENKIIHIKI